MAAVGSAAPAGASWMNDSTSAKRRIGVKLERGISDPLPWSSQSAIRLISRRCTGGGRDQAVEAEEGDGVRGADRANAEPAGLVLRERRGKRAVDVAEADHLVAVAGEPCLHEQLDVAVGVRARNVETGRAAPRDIAEARLDQAVADVAGVAEPDRVELHDRPLVAVAVALDAEEPREVAVALVDVQEVVRAEGTERQAEEGEDADGRTRDRKAERAGARVLGLGEAGQLAEGGQVRQAGGPNLGAAGRRLDGSAGHAPSSV